jgi:hypothetical protein
MKFLRTKAIMEARVHGDPGLGHRHLIVVVMVAISVIVAMIFQIPATPITMVLAMLETWAVVMA